MDATVWIAIWAFSFLASHLIISSSAFRSCLINAVGEQPYRGIYSLVAAATLTALIIEFGHHKHSGPMLWYLRGTPPIRWITWLLMLAALIFLAGSFINPNPGAMGAPGGRAAPRGLLKITRHPGLAGFSLFGIAHMLMNGWAGDVIFFGMFPALGILGGLHQDTRKIREPRPELPRVHGSDLFGPVRSTNRRPRPISARRHPMGRNRRGHSTDGNHRRASPADHPCRRKCETHRGFHIQ